MGKRRTAVEQDVSEPETLTVDVNGFATRVWRMGSGPMIGFLAGFGGLPRWVPFLDELAKSRTVIVPSLPGFPGGDRGHSVLDTHLDWLLAVRDLLAKAGLDGADLAGSSVGASMAAEMAAGVKLSSGSARATTRVSPSIAIGSALAWRRKRPVRRSANSG